MGSSTTVQLAALTRMFSARVIRELGENGHSQLLVRLLRESGLSSQLGEDATLATAFEAAFEALRRLGSRDDYVYRAAITQKVAFGRHNVRTATVVNEMRAGASKVDVVIYNGTSTAYEIKSERDNLKRLPAQLQDYQSVFAAVNVVTSPMQCDEVLQLAPQHVGVIVLSKRFRLQVARRALDQPERTDPLAILETLRIDEAVAVLTGLGIEFPQVPNTRRRGLLRAIYATLDPVRVHTESVRVLKSTRSPARLGPYLERLPVPLRPAALAAELSDASRARLQSATLRPVANLFAWSEDPNVLPLLSRKAV